MSKPADTQTISAAAVPLESYRKSTTLPTKVTYTARLSEIRLRRSRTDPRHWPVLAVSNELFSLLRLVLDDDITIAAIYTSRAGRKLVVFCD